jgi:hypothetical protein
MVLIGDVVNSKQISDRNRFQQKLNRVFTTINQQSEDILSPYTVTLGDEFQAVYGKSKTILTDMVNILSQLYPANIRFSIGYDILSTPINEEAALGMDGPAFHLAREGLERLKKADYSIIQVYGTPFDNVKLINASLRLATSMMSSWKKNTLFIFNEILNRNPVKEIAPKIGITERGVYKLINTHKLKEYKDYYMGLNDTIMKLMD